MNTNTLCNLAASQLRLGKLQHAADLFEQAAHLEPNRVQTWFDLGRTLSALGRNENALEAFERILEIQPEHAEAHNARGIMLSHLGRREEALACFSLAHTLKPDYPAPLNNLGNEYFSLADYKTALDHYERALALNAGFTNAWVGRGNTLLLLERGEDALNSFDQALALLPGDLDALNGRGNSLALLKRYDEALQSYAQADAIAPNEPSTRNNRGNVYKLMGRHEEALLEYDRALSLGPVSNELLINKGIVLNKLGKTSLALAAFRAALAHNADNVRALIGCADALRDLGFHSQARDTLEQGLNRHFDNAELLSGALFNLNYFPGISPQEILARHRRYGELVETPHKSCWPTHSGSRDPARSLRIGFVSGDLRKHPVGYFMESTFQALAGNAFFELYAYANQPIDDALTERIRPCFRQWRDIWKQSDDNAAALIRADDIDILVDLSGHTAYHRLPVFARKPAPLQVTYLGYSGTTGLTAIDYILGNHWLMPLGEVNCHTEKPWRLPDTQLCYTPPDLDVPVSPLPAMKNGYITFGNFNNLAKMNDDSLACWAKILMSVPESRLVLKAKQFNIQDVISRVRVRFQSHGVAPERLILLEQTESIAEHMASYASMDIALDPFPYNGTTTSMDALWMGIPILSLRGDRYIGRVGASILEVMNMSNWIATDENDYIERAVQFSGNLATLASLRADLRQRFLNSPLCDAPRFATHLEQAFRAMWQRRCHARE